MLILLFSNTKCMLYYVSKFTQQCILKSQQVTIPSLKSIQFSGGGHKETNKPKLCMYFHNENPSMYKNRELNKLPFINQPDSIITKILLISFIYSTLPLLLCWCILKQILDMLSYLYILKYEFLIWTSFLHNNIITAKTINNDTSF